MDPAQHLPKVNSVVSRRRQRQISSQRFPRLWGPRVPAVFLPTLAEEQHTLDVIRIGKGGIGGNGLVAGIKRFLEVPAVVVTDAEIAERQRGIGRQLRGLGERGDRPV